MRSGRTDGFQERRFRYLAPRDVPVHCLLLGLVPDRRVRPSEIHEEQGCAGVETDFNAVVGVARRLQVRLH